MAELWGSLHSLFKVYNNTSLNLIPLVQNKSRKVYVLTGPEESGVVIFGNDYLLTFDQKNRITSKKRLHRNIIPIEYGNRDGQEGQADVTMHSHVPETGDHITATDICTLMLYEKFAGWKTHNVVSRKYFSIWNCETDQLTVLPVEALEKIMKDQEVR